jgi:AcrR family transcriptional regulator
MKETIDPKARRACDESLWASRREQILEAATKLFAKHGYADADTQLLAEKLGIGKGTIYRYFPSKEDVFLAAADRVMRKMRTTIDESILGIEDPFEQIGTAIRSYLIFFADNPDFVELLMQERAQFKDRKKPTYFEYREANLERWRSRYRVLIAEGRIREMPVERITDVLGDLLYGTMFTNFFTGRRKDPDVQAREILDVVFHGILSDSERGQRKPSKD